MMSMMCSSLLNNLVTGEHGVVALAVRAYMGVAVREVEDILLSTPNGLG